MAVVANDDDIRIEKLSLGPFGTNAYILVCFLAYVLWKMVGQMVKRVGLGDGPRKILDEIAQIKVVDVVMPTKQGVEIRKRCVAQPTKAPRYIGIT